MKSPEEKRHFLGVRLRGFTILELLVAMAVFAILVVMLMGMVDSGTKLWRENENRVDAFREARATLTVMERDLRNAIQTTNADYVLINDTAFPKLGSDALKDATNAGAIFFLSAQPTSAQDSGNKSDVCQVGYFLAFANNSLVPSGQKTMNLYRYFRSSDATYTNLVAGGSTLFADTGVTGENTDLLAKNITSFRITPYHLTTNGNRVAYNSTTYGSTPDMLEISVTALNQDTARKLSTLEDWTTPTGPITNIVNKVEQTFTTRVRMKDRQ